jgi:HEAT repeat protein
LRFYEGAPLEDNEMRAMLIEYMGKGFLDNIIAMFRQDRSLYRFVADMLGDEQVRVRLGATALVEELVGEQREGLNAAVPGLIALLKHENPTIRGDVLSVLGIIKARTARAAVEDCLTDVHAGVREAAQEALDAIVEAG